MLIVTFFTSELPYGDGKIALPVCCIFHGDSKIDFCCISHRDNKIVLLLYFSVTIKLFYCCAAFLTVTIAFYYCLYSVELYWTSCQ